MSDKVVGKWLKRITMMRLNDANNKKKKRQSSVTSSPIDDENHAATNGSSSEQTLAVSSRSVRLS